MKINQVHTICRDCAFAEYVDGKPIGCSAGRLKVYQDTGAEILEAYDDDDKEFFVINDRICVYHREKEWAKQFSSSEVLNIVESQIKSPYALIINFDKDSTIEGLTKTLSSLAVQFNSPSYITINNWVVENVYALNRNIENAISSSGIVGIKGKWQIKTILDSDTSFRSAIDFAFDTFKHISKFHFYIYVNSGQIFPESFTKEIHQSIFDHGKKPLLCEGINDSDDFMLVNYLMHKKHAGNSFSIKLEDKIKEFEEDWEKHIYSIKDICSCLM